MVGNPFFLWLPLVTFVKRSLLLLLFVFRYLFRVLDSSLQLTIGYYTNKRRNTSLFYFQFYIVVDVLPKLESIEFTLAPKYRIIYHDTKPENYWHIIVYFIHIVYSFSQLKILFYCYLYGTILKNLIVKNLILAIENTIHFIWRHYNSKARQFIMFILL